MTNLLCADFIESLYCMLAGKTLLDYTDFFFPNEYNKNDKIIFILKTMMVEKASLEFR